MQHLLVRALLLRLSTYLFLRHVHGISGELAEAEESVLLEDNVVLDEEGDDRDEGGSHGNGDGGDGEKAGSEEEGIDGEED